jgi:hypothetical protein
MTDNYPFLAPGDQATFDLTTGRGVAGEVVSVDLAPDGTWRCLSLRVPDRDEVLRVHGVAIAAWRLGQPMRQPTPQQQIAIPLEQLPPGLLGPNGRQP